MILRKLWLGELKKEYESLSWFFDKKLNKRLILWFDGISEEEVKALGNFFEEKYSLKQGSQDKEYQEKGISFIEYANISLCHLDGGGNLFRYYQKLENKNLEIHLKGNKTCRELQHSLYRSQDPEKNARNIKKYLKSMVEDTARQEYSKSLKNLFLGFASSVWMVTLKDLDHTYYTTATHDAPRQEYNAPKIEPILMKLSFIPFNRELLMELTGFLVGKGIKYETPRHEELLQGILEEKIKEYSGHALYEHHQQHQQQLT